MAVYPTAAASAATEPPEAPEPRHPCDACAHHCAFLRVEDGMVDEVHACCVERDAHGTLGELHYVYAGDTAESMECDLWERDPPRRTVAGNLRRLMGGMSQRELARRAGTTEAAVSRYLSDQREPGARMVVALCHALGCAPNDLLKGVAP